MQQVDSAHLTHQDWGNFPPFTLVVKQGRRSWGQGGNCPPNFYVKGQNSQNFLGIKKNVVARKPIDTNIIQLETITQSLIP